MQVECEECGKKGPSGLQPKLTVNRTGDVYEQEADRVADQALAVPVDHAVKAAPLRIQRFAGHPPENARTVPASVDRALTAPGRPLEPAFRQDMQRRFGYDFSGVRVHTDAAAAHSARDVNARAYTVGKHIVFGSGQFTPSTHAGRRLIAHELTHVVQQNQSISHPTGHIQRAPDDGPPPACADWRDDPAEVLHCEGRGRDGPGNVVPDATGWELRNFDVDRHFLKKEHRDGLRKIVPAVHAFLKATKGMPAQVLIVGEASTTAGTCYNLRLSRRRAKCVARALVALGIPAPALKVEWIGDIASEARLALKADPTRLDRENPNDRRVRILLQKAKPPKPKEKCTLEDRLRTSGTLDFRFGCLSRSEFAVVIADRTRNPPIYREFVWEKLFALPPDCEFFPEPDPASTVTTALAPAVRLAWTEQADAPSDFSRVAIQRSLRTRAGGDPLHFLEFASNGQDTWVAFPGTWEPARCAKDLRSGKSMRTVGFLRPTGPVKCGPMPVPKAAKCARPSEEDCPASRRDSEARRFKVDSKPVPLTRKIIELLGDRVEGSEVRYIRIGSVKTDKEKKAGGDDIWRPYIFAGKAVYAPKGCEQRDPQDGARGETKLDDAQALSGVNYRPATLVRKANSNEEHLWIVGMGTFRLYGEKCTSGGLEIIQGAVTHVGKVRCEPLKMDGPPSAKTCKDECPQARRTCPETTFRFRFGRMAPASAPPAVRELLLRMGCQGEAARVNIGALALHPIWRPFIWVQAAPCPFTVRNASLYGLAGKVSVGIKPKLRFKWPPITAAPVVTSDGLRLATRDPDNPSAPTEFPGTTKLSSASLTGSARGTSLGITSGLTRTYYEMATSGSPVDWTGRCRSSDTGVLFPAGKVDCGWAPAPAHDPAPQDACPADLGMSAANAAFLMRNYGLLASLGRRSGIVTQLVSAGRPVYAAGQVVPDARFVGQVYGAGNALEPVVVVFDMKVLRVIPYPGRIEVHFTILSRPCAYRWGIERVPLRLFSFSCAESLRQGQSYTISTDFKPLPLPDGTTA